MNTIRMITGVLGMILIVTGCSTVRSRMTVGNSGNEAIGEVSVVSGATVLFEAHCVNPHSSGGRTQLPKHVPQQATLSWMNIQGQTFTNTVELAVLPPDELNQTYYIQISSNNAVKVFLLTEEDFKVSALPWAQPQEWETAPNIPGLNHR